MTIYEANATKFEVEKQTDHALCWAASARAVLTYHKMDSPSQAGLAEQYRSDAITGGNPLKVLRERGFKVHNLLGDEWKTPATSESTLAQRTTDLGLNLKYHLSPAGGPLLCGLIEANNAVWTPEYTTEKNGKTSVTTINYTWKHATLIFRYDDQTEIVSFMDPARPDTKGRRVDTNIRDLVRGFDYISVTEFGPKTIAALGGMVSDIVRARIFILAGLIRPKN